MFTFSSFSSTSVPFFPPTTLNSIDGAGGGGRRKDLHSTNKLFLHQTNLVLKQKQEKQDIFRENNKPLMQQLGHIENTAVVSALTPSSASPTATTNAKFTFCLNIHVLPSVVQNTEICFHAVILKSRRVSAVFLCPLCLLISLPHQ